MLKSMLLLLYHGCMRISEIVKSPKNNHALKLCNVRVLSKNNKPQALSLTLDSFKHSTQPVSFKIRKNDNQQLCPVKTLIDYVSVRGYVPGPLFINKNGKPTNRQFLAVQLKKWIKELGLSPNSYNTHSLRIGRATDMAAAGVPDQVIKATGRWKTDAFVRYIRFDNFTVPRV